MSPRQYYRPSVEQLERRDAPSGLSGCLRVRTTVSGTLSATSDTITLPHVHLGPITGHAVLHFTRGVSGNETGTLIIKTNLGKVIVSETGNANLFTQKFTAHAKVVRGTGTFLGLHGSLNLSGSFTLTGSFTATITGHVGRGCPATRYRAGVGNPARVHLLEPVEFALSAEPNRT